MTNINASSCLLAIPVSFAGEFLLERMDSKLTLVILAVLMLRAAASGMETAPCGPLLLSETPSCSVFSRELGYQLREYPAGQHYIETFLENSTYETASSIGYYRLAAYINGDNSQKLQLSMAEPFTIHPFPSGTGYTVAFFLSNRIGTPPEPTDKTLHIRQTGRTLQAVIGPFGGFIRNETIYLHYTRELIRYLQRDKIDYDFTSVTYAEYSSPIEIVNRQQEVLIQVFLD